MEYKQAMGFFREVRIVDLNWSHPKIRDLHGHDKLVPMTAAQQVPTGSTGFQMYETATLGTPISPVFQSVEDLLDWLIENQVGILAGCPGTREQWQKIVEQSDCFRNQD